VRDVEERRAVWCGHLNIFSMYRVCIRRHVIYLAMVLGARSKIEIVLMSLFKLGIY